jgi:hypothetical protein
LASFRRWQNKAIAAQLEQRTDYATQEQDAQIHKVSAAIQVQKARTQSVAKKEVKTVPQ